MRATLICGYTDRFQDTVRNHASLVSSLLRFVNLLNLDKRLGFSTCHDFALIEWTLSPVRKLLVTTKI